MAAKDSTRGTLSANELSAFCAQLALDVYKRQGLGRFGNAAANGDLFPVVYSFGRFGLSAPGGV